MFIATGAPQKDLAALGAKPRHGIAGLPLAVIALLSLMAGETFRLAFRFGADQAFECMKSGSEPCLAVERSF